MWVCKLSRWRWFWFLFFGIECLLGWFVIFFFFSYFIGHYNLLEGTCTSASEYSHLVGYMNKLLKLSVFKEIDWVAKCKLDRFYFSFFFAVGGLVSSYLCEVKDQRWVYSYNSMVLCYIDGFIQPQSSFGLCPWFSLHFQPPSLLLLFGELF